MQLAIANHGTHQFDSAMKGFKIASHIGLAAKDTLAMKVDGVERDLGFSIHESAAIEFITRESTDALELLRHDCAHVLAQAVKELYDDVQVTFGPAIENGFYYDFHRATPFTPDDFNAIEKQMRAIVKRDEKFTRHVWSRDEAVEFFQNQGETFKAEHIAAIPAEEELSIYQQGDWYDLCRGPHLPSTRYLGTAFKLLKVSGAYWKGQSDGARLQRIYGTCWRNEEELQAYLQHLKEVELRDHRRLGTQLGLFHTQEEAAGSVFWHPKGWTLYRLCVEYMRAMNSKYGYVEVNTPQMVDRRLWEKSGHWEKFRENMFTLEDDGDRVYALKPMNCPCHVQVFNQNLTSYRELPIRMSEFGHVHRNESSGALQGLLRVRAFTQDDAHVFCRPDQLIEESLAICRFVQEVYRDFGFENLRVRFSDRPDVRAGRDELWDKAELALRQACEAAQLETELNPGEGAFYGPKLEFVLADALGREWQCGTLQVDFVLPERLEATYIDSQSTKQHAVILHRAIFGSMERFIGILIEHYTGNFPLWLAPTQVAVASISERSEEWAKTVHDQLKGEFRSTCDIRSEKISYKIRELQLQKIPQVFVVGEKEAAQGTVNIRYFGQQEQQTLPIAEAIAQLRQASKPPHA